MTDADLQVEITTDSQISVNFAYPIHEERIRLIAAYLDYLKVLRYQGEPINDALKKKIKQEVLDFIVFLERRYH